MTGTWTATETFDRERNSWQYTVNRDTGRNS